MEGDDIKKYLRAKYFQLCHAAKLHKKTVAPVQISTAGNELLLAIYMHGSVTVAQTYACNPPILSMDGYPSNNMSNSLNTATTARMAS